MSEEVTYTEEQEKVFFDKLNNEPGYWSKSLSEDYLADKTVGKYVDGTFIEVPKAMVNQAKLIGGEKIQRPDPEGKWGAEDWKKWNETFNAGYPNNSEEYTIDVEYPEDYLEHVGGQEALDKIDAFTKDLAHKNGLTKEQYKRLVEGARQKSIEDYQAGQRFLEQRKEQLQAELRREFGDGYTDKVNLLNNAMSKFFSAEDIKLMHLETAPPSIMKGMIKMAEQFSEGKADLGEHRSGPTYNELIKQKEALFNHAAYTDAMHPEHKSVLGQLDKVFEKLAAYKKR
jgi:hypothetical protein